MLISAPAVETPVGAAFFAASGTVALGGTVVTSGGLFLQTAGGLILYAQGDPQPLLSASLQDLQTLGEDRLGVPPLPFTDPLDALVDVAAGESTCQVTGQ